MTDLKPTPEDKFSFGIWTVQYPGRDPFGEPTRAADGPGPRRATSWPRSAPTASTSTTTTWSPSAPTTPSASKILDALPQGARRHRPGRHHRHHEPVHPPGLQGRRLHLQRPRRAPLRDLKKVMRNIDLAAELGAKIYVAGAAARVPSPVRPRTSPTALDRYQEAFNLLGEFVTDRGYDIRFAIEPKPNEPRGDILLPTVGHAMAFIETLDRPELVGDQPRDRPRGDGRPQRRRRLRPGAVAGQALPHRPQRPERSEVRPGPALRRRQRARRVLGRRHAARRRVRRPGALRLQDAAHRGRRRGVGRPPRPACATT